MKGWVALLGSRATQIKIHKDVCSYYLLCGMIIGNPSEEVFERNYNQG